MSTSNKTSPRANRGNKENENPERSNNETVTNEFIRMLNEVKKDIREFREDVLVNSWINESRLDVLEKVVKKLDRGPDRMVTFEESLGAVGHVRKISIEAAKAIFFNMHHINIV